MTMAQQRRSICRPGSAGLPAPYRPRRDDWVVDTATGFIGRFQALTTSRAYIRPYGGGIECETSDGKGGGQQDDSNSGAGHGGGGSDEGGNTSDGQGPATGN
jgi:hypothetical protein